MRSPTDLLTPEHRVRLRVVQPFGPGRTAFGLLRAMRPHQWTKNLVVVTPAVFALRFNPHVFLSAGVAFACFCAVTSGAYLLNDARDAEDDRSHPVKRNRPIAAGVVSVPMAQAVGVTLIAASLLAAYLYSPALAFVILLYALLQALYSARLKHEPIIDVLCIATGFVFRALGGAAAEAIPLSAWFLLCIALLALFLAVEKRLSEVRMVAGSTRKVLQQYSESWLLRMEAVVGASALMSYGLWAAQRTNNHWMLATLPIVAYVLFKYQMLSEAGAEDAPERVLLKSPMIIAAIGLWTSMTLAILLLQDKVPTWASCAAGC